MTEALAEKHVPSLAFWRVFFCSKICKIVLWGKQMDQKITTFGSVLQPNIKYHLIKQLHILPPLGTNISPPRALFKVIFLLLRRDMLVPEGNMFYGTSSSKPFTLHFTLGVYRIISRGFFASINVHNNNNNNNDNNKNSIMKTATTNKQTNKQTIKQSIKQSINQSINQTINQTI